MHSLLWVFGSSKLTFSHPYVIFLSTFYFFSYRPRPGISAWAHHGGKQWTEMSKMKKGSGDLAYITFKVKGSPFLNMVFISERWRCYVYSHGFLACRSPLGQECHHGERKVFTFTTSSLPCASAFKMTAGTKGKSLLGGYFLCLSLGETKRGMLLRMLGCGEKWSSHRGAIHACRPELRPTYLWGAWNHKG